MTTIPTNNRECRSMAQSELRQIITDLDIIIHANRLAELEEIMPNVCHEQNQRAWNRTIGDGMYVDRLAGLANRWAGADLEEAKGVARTQMIGTLDSARREEIHRLAREIQRERAADAYSGDDGVHPAIQRKRREANKQKVGRRPKR